ncbi:MAG TPA: class I SAM-dependent methyltransferase [Candidatus Acidoferrales bacterium]|nr:class I SAM-dependent methyltransferase [Candidatus Acidoferrales bacterium]
METYGQDFGQTSLVTTEESKEIPPRLVLKPDSSVLELGCGSGGYALYVAETVGCRVVGLDINAPGVRNANQLAAARGLAERVHFEQCDASKRLPFEDGTFDAVFSNDVLCHLAARPMVLGEMFRILKPGGRMLFSDALVVGGMLSHEEIATRSSIGFYILRISPGEMNWRRFANCEAPIRSLLDTMSRTISFRMVGNSDIRQLFPSCPSSTTNRFLMPV